MTSTNMLPFAGIACLLLSFLALRKLMPQNGNPPSAWTRTETRSMLVSIVLMMLMITGVALIIRGVMG